MNQTILKGAVIRITYIGMDSDANFLKVKLVDNKTEYTILIKVFQLNT